MWGQRARSARPWPAPTPLGFPALLGPRASFADSSPPIGLDSSGPPGHSFKAWEERDAQLFAAGGVPAGYTLAAGAGGLAHTDPHPRRWRRGALYSVLGIYLSTWTPSEIPARGTPCLQDSQPVLTGELPAGTRGRTIARLCPAGVWTENLPPAECERRGGILEQVTVMR